MSSEPHFQEYQFDKRLNREQHQNIEALPESGTAHGFQIIEVELKNRELPEWAKTKEGIQKLLLTAFPKLHINQLQRQRAGRWAQVIELFYKKSWTESDVAQELNETVAAVRSILRGITRTAQGRTVRGKIREQA